MIHEHNKTRRWFLGRAAIAALGGVGVGQAASLLAANVASGAPGARDSKKKPLRLDSHVHINDSKGIEPLRQYIAGDGLTHYVAIVPDLKLIDELDRAVLARCIPFYRLREPLKEPTTSFGDSRVAGYKIHLRHPATKDAEGQTVAATDKHIGKICAEAGRLGRPLLLHSDADEPEICSLRMLAELARRYPQTTIIAAHAGMLSQEYQADKSNPKEWEAKLRPLVPANIRLLLDVKNLYADVTLLGRDFPVRSADPNFKLKLLIKEVDALRPAARMKLRDKLFIGTDFPAFRKVYDPRIIGYSYQAECMREVFKKDFDEDRMTRNFVKLLPRKFAA